MKKFLAVLLAMTMLLGVLTACSENTQQSADDPSGGQTATQTYNLVWAATSASSGDGGHHQQVCGWRYGYGYGDWRNGRRLQVYA